MTTAAQVLNVARAELGYQEGYNDWTKYGSWYGMNNAAWCDIFVSWVGNRAHGNTGLLGKYAYTPAHADWFKSKGRWSTSPKVGSIVFFQWAGWSRICHVGIVEAVNSGSIVTIEGNTNLAGDRLGAGVFRQNRNRLLKGQGGYVAGYGHPLYTTTATAPPPPPSPSTSVYGGGAVYLSKLKYGQQASDSVKNLQARLVASGYGGYMPTVVRNGPTGNYGPETDAAVRACQAQHVPPADPAGRSYVGSKQANHLFAYAGSPYRIYP
jgi:surface antigen